MRKTVGVPHLFSLFLLLLWLFAVAVAVLAGAIPGTMRHEGGEDAYTFEVHIWTGHKPNATFTIGVGSSKVWLIEFDKEVAEWKDDDKRLGFFRLKQQQHSLSSTTTRHLEGEGGTTTFKVWNLAKSAEVAAAHGWGELEVLVGVDKVNPGVPLADPSYQIQTVRVPVSNDAYKLHLSTPQQYIFHFVEVRTHLHPNLPINFLHLNLPINLDHCLIDLPHEPRLPSSPNHPPPSDAPRSQFLLNDFDLVFSQDARKIDLRYRIQ